MAARLSATDVQKELHEKLTEYELLIAEVSEEVAALKSNILWMDGMVKAVSFENRINRVHRNAKNPERYIVSPYRGEVKDSAITGGDDVPKYKIGSGGDDSAYNDDFIVYIAGHAYGWYYSAEELAKGLEAKEAVKAIKE